MEGGKLVRQQVSRTKEDESADADEVVSVAVQHH